MTRLDVLQQLRTSTGPEADVDVLMVTAADDAESVRRALRGGVGGDLVTPFSGDELGRRLEPRRYLEHFSRTGGAEVSARYGGTGRPERRFRAP